MIPRLFEIIRSLTFRQTIMAGLAVMAALNGWQFAQAAGLKPGFGVQTSAPTPLPLARLTGDQSLNANPEARLAAAETTLAPAASPIAARLTAAGFNPDYAELYRAAAQATGTPWQLLAAVHRLETGQSSNTNRRSYAGAIGPMQFLPATFKAYATDGNNDGITDITSLHDAVYSAGRYLAANGANRGNYRTALYRYNHSNAYVNRALTLAHQLGL